MSLLTITTVGATLLHIALSVTYFTYTFAFYDEELVGALTVVISFTVMTMLRLTSGVSIIWTDLHNGRLRGLGAVFAGLMFLGGFALFFSLLYVPMGFLLLVLAGWNIYKWRDGGEE